MDQSTQSRNRAIILRVRISRYQISTAQGSTLQPFTTKTVRLSLNPLRYTKTRQSILKRKQKLCFYSWSRVTNQISTVESWWCFELITDMTSYKKEVTSAQCWSLKQQVQIGWRRFLPEMLLCHLSMRQFCSCFCYFPVWGNQHANHWRSLSAVNFTEPLYFQTR